MFLCLSLFFLLLLIIMKECFSTFSQQLLKPQGRILLLCWICLCSLSSRSFFAVADKKICLTMRRKRSVAHKNDVKIKLLIFLFLFTPIACFMKFDSDQQRLHFAIDIFTLFKDQLRARKKSLFLSKFIFSYKSLIHNPPL